MTVAPGPAPLDSERQAVQSRLEAAVGEGRLTLDEFTERCGRVWSADEPAELHAALADLPVAVVGQKTGARSTLISLIGDITRRGRFALRSRTTAWLVIGDLELDLRGALVDAGDITITACSLIGDVEVIAPEGVEVELRGFTVLGDRKVDLSPVPRVPGTPTVHVRVFSLIGDTKIRGVR